MSLSRNSPCPCGSGKKYKRCCGENKTETGVSGLDIAVRDAYKQAMSFYQQGNLQAAQVVCEQQLRVHPNSPQFIELSAAVSLQLDDVEGAALRFKQQVKLLPNNAAAHTNLCMVLHALGRDEEAYTHCRKALSIEPNQAGAYNNIGNIHLGRNNLDDAIENYEKAIQLGINDPRVYVNAGKAAQLTGDLVAAEKRYIQALNLLPDFVPALQNLGVVKQKLGDYKQSQQYLERAIDIEPRNPELYCNLGSVMFDMDENDKAEECFHEAVRINEKFSGAYVNLGILKEREGSEASSVEYFEKALSIEPNEPTALYNLGCIYFEQGHTTKAINTLVHSLKSDPHYAKAYAGLGEALLRQGKVAKAELYINKSMELASYDVVIQRANSHLLEEKRDFDNAVISWQKVISMKPTAIDGYVGLASMYTDLDQFESARAVYHDAEKNTEPTVRLYHSWCQLEEKTHNLDVAEVLAMKAESIDPGYAGLAVIRAKLARRKKEYRTGLNILEATDISLEKRIEVMYSYYFELGNIYDKLNLFDDAFHAYETANNFKNEYVGEVYDSERDLLRQKSFRKFFTRDNLKAFQSLKADVIQSKFTPVFIVGFPRSGTSLLEQILGSHTSISPAGELLFIGDIVSQKAKEVIGSDLPWPELLADESKPVTAEKLGLLKQFYLDSVKSLNVVGENAKWVTDKMPHNALHVGLIHMLFPESPIIHISRHPFNSCLSAYFSNFNVKHRYTSSIESTAVHYKNMMDTLDSYRENLDLNFLEIHYEDLVDDQEATTRKVLDFIGAPWDDKCLQHHKSKRVVRTASYEQVTQKIYRTSLYRYRNYWKHVEPLIPILESTIKRYGYEVE